MEDSLAFIVMLILVVIIGSVIGTYCGDKVANGEWAPTITVAGIVVIGVIGALLW